MVDNRHVYDFATFGAVAAWVHAPLVPAESGGPISNAYVMGSYLDDRRPGGNGILAALRNLLHNVQIEWKR